MAHTFAPFRDLDVLEPATAAPPNVGVSERVGSAALGSALTAYGLARRDLLGGVLAIAGGLLIYRGATGRCQCYQKLGIDTAGGNDGRGVPNEAGVKVEKDIIVSRPRMELYHFWRQLENLPAIMPHLESVTVDGERSHWIVKGPAGHRVEWDAEVINDNPGELIAWQSLPGGEVHSAGSVHFDPVGEGATRVSVKLAYLPPAGKAGALVARLFDAAPDQQLETDLARFKEKLEAT